MAKECQSSPSGFIHGSNGVLKVAIQPIYLKSFFLSLVVLGMSVLSVNAQNKVVLVDIGQVFKSHPVFSQQLDGLKAEADRFKEDTQRLQQDLMAEAEGLKAFKPDSDGFRQLETKLAQDSAALEVQQMNKLRGLMEREARLHFDTYMEIKDAITTYCQERGIKLVMRHNSEPMAPNEIGSIMQKVNGKVVYFRPENEITQQIVVRIAAAQNGQLQK